jgi:hypothetical protein
MMNYRKKLCLTALTVTALLALIGTGTASATTLEVGGVAQNKSVTIEASLKPGTSAILKDTNNATVETCTDSRMKGSTSSPFTGPSVTWLLIVLTTDSCSHTDHVLAAGIIHFYWTSGTNATVVASKSEVTIQSTIFGASCIAKTGTGTTIGTLTGVKEGHATMDINGVIPMGLCGDAVWTGTYTITSPTGLGAGA